MRSFGVMATYVVAMGLGACSQTTEGPGQGGLGAERPAAGGGGATSGMAGSGGNGGAAPNAGHCDPPVESRHFDKGIWAVDVNAIALDASGNLGLTGIAQTDIDVGGGVLPGGGLTDVLVAKFDAAGKHLFSKRYGKQGDQRGDSIAFDSRCNLVLGGSFAGTMDLGGATLTGSRSLFVAKLDGAGDHVWSKRLEGASAMGPLFLFTAIDPTTDEVVLAGTFTGTIDFGGGNVASASDARPVAFVAKLDADGRYLWSKRFPGSVHPSGLAVDPVGDIVMVGLQGGAVDYGGGPLGPDDRLARGPFLVRLDGSGGYKWSNRWEGTDNLAEIQGVALDANGAAFIAGSTGCGLDLGGGPLESAGCHRSAFAAKLDADGTHRFSRLLDSSDGSVAQSVGLSPAGSVLVAGLFGGAMDVESGVLATEEEGGAGFVVALDGAGTATWGKDIVGTLEKIHGLAVDRQGEGALLGRTLDDVDLAGGTAVGRGDFVMKLF